MTEASFQSIVIIGSGLAAALCVAALSKWLPDHIALTYVETTDETETDMFYGTVTSPSAYDFLLKLGITEPDMLPNSQTSFSLGTHYKAWGAEKRSWTQCFHSPLPILDGVSFQHYLARLRETAPHMAELEPYIMSVHAARRGVFAHPPEGQKTPLTTIEYGYHFLSHEWREIFYRNIKRERVKFISSDIKKISRDMSGVTSITLENSQSLKADLYIDCRSQGSPIDLLDTPNFEDIRTLSAVESFGATDQMKGVCRTIAAMPHGWLSETPLQQSQHKLAIFDTSTKEDTLSALGIEISSSVDFTLGKLKAPWQGNVLAFGQKAGVLEPLSPAPIMLLQRDMERLAELIPISTDVSVERREYNRRFEDDYSHAEDFHRSLFEGSELDTPYWQTATQQSLSPKLDNKIIQFKSRGICVQYDLEPFEADEWRQQHLGLGRLPTRYDPLADRVSDEDLKNTLEKIRSANETMAAKMPPHHVYMTGLLKYLRKKHGG